MSKKDRTLYDLPESEQAKLEKMTPEELQAYCDRTEKEIAETEEVTKRLDAWLDELPNTKLWEDLQVLAFELQDKLDDLNDELKLVEQNMAERRVRPGWVAFSKGDLIWDGKNLLFDGGKGQWVHLLRTSKEIRMTAVGALQPLFDEVTRERQPVYEPPAQVASDRRGRQRRHGREGDHLPPILPVRPNKVPRLAGPSKPGLKVGEAGRPEGRGLAPGPARF